MASTETSTYKSNLIPFQRPLLTNPGSTSSYFTGSAPARSAHIIYLMSDTDRALRFVSFIFNVITTIALGWLVFPLAWMIPMDIISWDIYKGTRPNTTAYGVATLVFVSVIGGILLLCSKKDR